MMENIHMWARRHGVDYNAVRELMHIIDPSGPVIKSSKTTEASVQSDLRLVAAGNNASLWRNNNGAATDDDGRHIRYGLGNDSAKLNKKWKSSDLIGITPRMSTEPGQVFGVFTAVEVKKPGWTKPTNERERAQARFLQTVGMMGGIAMFAQSTEDYTQKVFGT